jgi:anti-sigma regulatory factor (Ser/Thr protein kinase)
MKRRHWVRVTRAPAASVLTCLALLCVPAVSAAADPTDPPAQARGSTSALLALGAGYGKPHGAPRVRSLQRRLRASGLRPGPIDGYYGPLTKAAVERLQRDSGLSVDGIVGPETRRALKAESPPLAPGAGHGDSGRSRQVRDPERKAEVPTVVESRAAAADAGESTSPILLLALALALATSCGLVAAWLKRRRHRPPTRGVAATVPKASSSANGIRPGRVERSDTAALKARIRKMRASGMTLQAIADRLNADGVPTLGGGARWRPSGVQAAAGHRRAGGPARTATGMAAGHGNGAGGQSGRTPAPPGARSETWLPATSASSGEARSLVRAAAADAGLDGAPAWDLMLASTEAVNNAVQHGRAWPNGCIRFATEPCDRGLRVEVCDLGKFDSALEPAPLDATSGRGMQIIAALVDRLEVRNGDGRTLVRFEKHRPRVSSEEETTTGDTTHAAQALGSM